MDPPCFICQKNLILIACQVVGEPVSSFCLAAYFFRPFLIPEAPLKADTKTGLNVKGFTQGNASYSHHITLQVWPGVKERRKKSWVSYSLRKVQEGQQGVIKTKWVIRGFLRTSATLSILLLAAREKCDFSIDIVMVSQYGTQTLSQLRFW